MRRVWTISQQDNYSGLTDCVADSIITLYLNFEECKFCYINHTEEKDLHNHIILVLNKSRTKKDLLKFFPCADVKPLRTTLKNAFEYLTHKNNQDKHQYKIEDVVFHNSDINYWLTCNDYDINNKISEDNMALNLIVEDILNGVLDSYLDVLNKYGGIALKYSRSIKEVINDVKGEL